MTRLPPVDLIHREPFDAKGILPEVQKWRFFITSNAPPGGTGEESPGGGTGGGDDYPSEEDDPNTYWGRRLKHVTFDDDNGPGTRPLSYEESDDYQLIRFPQGAEYQPVGTVVLAFRENGRWFAIQCCGEPEDSGGGTGTGTGTGGTGTGGTGTGTGTGGTGGGDFMVPVNDDGTCPEGYSKVQFPLAEPCPGEATGTGTGTGGGARCGCIRNEGSDCCPGTGTTGTGTGTNGNGGEEGGFSPDGCASVAALAVNDTGNQDPCEDGGNYSGFGDNTGLGGSIDITVSNTTGGSITVDIDSTGDLLTAGGEHWDNQTISGGNDLTLTVATGFGGGARSQEFTIAITSGSCTGSITFTLNGVLT